MSHKQRALQGLKELHKESYLWSLCCCGYNEEMAKDVLQNSYLKVLEEKARFTEKAKLKTWFFSVIRFTAIDALRKRTLQVVPVVEASHIADNTPDPMVNESGSNFKQILGELSGQQREMLTLVFYNDMTVEAAAEVLEINLGTARTHYNRGKQNFKKRLLQLRKNGII